MRITPLELVIIEGGGLHSRFALRDSTLQLGREEPGQPDPGPGIYVSEQTVSRIHARLDWQPESKRYRLTHLSKTNGTFVNGLRISRPTLINPGDRVRMGNLVFEIRIGKGQHAEGNIEQVDLAALTRSVAGAPVEAVTWVAHTPIASTPQPMQALRSDAPQSNWIPAPRRKIRPTPVFSQPYDPIAVELIEFEPPPPVVPLLSPPMLENAWTPEEELVLLAPSEPRKIRLQELPPEEPPIEDREPETPAEVPVPKNKPYRRSQPKVGRNQQCPCGSGKKFKKCCGA